VFPGYKMVDDEVPCHDWRDGGEEVEVVVGDFSEADVDEAAAED